MWFLMGLGAVAAGLVLLLREGLPLLGARRTGVIHTRGTRPQRVEREVEPGRFEQLYRQRAQGLHAPAIFILAGLGWLVLNGASLLLQGG